MSDDKQNPRMNYLAAICIAIAVVGLAPGIYLCQHEPAHTVFGCIYLLIACPTTPLGIAGGIGALYGRLGLGLLLGAIVDAFLWVGEIVLAIGGSIG